MESRRKAPGRKSFVLLILWSLTTALSGMNLDCSHHFEWKMSCQFEEQNCSTYSLNIKTESVDKIKSCTFEQCEVGRCCCSVEMYLIAREEHKATILKGKEVKLSTKIDTNNTFKPKAPTITSVRESNGNYYIKWKTNTELDSLSIDLSANVTYRKKGDAKNVTVEVTQSAIKGENEYEILGKFLDPSSTYLVSVRSFSPMSDRFSDSSEEKEFTTPMPSYVLPVAIVVSLSFATILLVSVSYFSFIKVKTKWWDTVAKCPIPKLLILHQEEQEVLKPIPPFISSVYVETLIPDDGKPWSKVSLSDSSSVMLQTSGTSAGSAFSYANTEPLEIIACRQDALSKVFANINISAVTPPTNAHFPESSEYNASDDLGVAVDFTNSGSSCFENKTYFIPQTELSDGLTDRSEVQTELPCDSDYHPSVSEGITQNAPVCEFTFPPMTSPSLIATEMSYQQAAGFSDSSGNSILCDSGSAANFDEAPNGEGAPEGDGAPKGDGADRIEPVVCDENPCYGGVPSSSFPPVEDAYQSFQTLLDENSDTKWRPEEENKEIWDKYPEDSTTKMLLSPCLMDGVTLIPTELITDSGYQSVVDIC